MNKIDKLDKELEKAREKAAEWQAKIRELEKQKQEGPLLPSWEFITTR